MSYPDVVGVNELVNQAHKTAKSHGFWSETVLEDLSQDVFVTVVLSKLALIASELGEAVEATRLDDGSNLGEELADICIRVFDLSGGLKVDLQREILSKMAKNETRPYMHGKLA